MLYPAVKYPIREEMQRFHFHENHHRFRRQEPLRRTHRHGAGRPVRVQRRGRDVAVVLSPEEFRHLSEAAQSRVSRAVERLHAGSVKRWARVYEALAK